MQFIKMGFPFTRRRFRTRPQRRRPYGSESKRTPRRVFMRARAIRPEEESLWRKKKKKNSNATKTSGGRESRCDSVRRIRRTLRGFPRNFLCRDVPPRSVRCVLSRTRRSNTSDVIVATIMEKKINAGPSCTRND